MSPRILRFESVRTYHLQQTYQRLYQDGFGNFEPIEWVYLLNVPTGGSNDALCHRVNFSLSALDLCGE